MSLLFVCPSTEGDCGAGHYDVGRMNLMDWRRSGRKSPKIGNCGRFSSITLPSSGTQHININIKSRKPELCAVCKGTVYSKIVVN